MCHGETEAAKAGRRGQLAKSLGITSLDAVFDASPAVKAELFEGITRLDEKWPRANASDLVEHIDYATKLIGIDHFGIASDFQGGGGISGWSNAGKTLDVTRKLLGRGYTADEIAKLWGGKLMRVLDEASALGKHD